MDLEVQWVIRRGGVAILATGRGSEGQLKIFAPGRILRAVGGISPG